MKHASKARRAALSALLSVSLATCLAPAAYAIPASADTAAAAEQVHLANQADTQLAPLDANEAVADAFLKKGASLSPDFQGTWTVATEGERSYAVAAVDATATVEVTQTGWIIFEPRVQKRGTWQDDGLTLTATQGETKTSLLPSRFNGSSSPAHTQWSMQVFKITATESNPCTLTWAYSSTDSSCVAHIDQVRFVSESVAVMATATEGGTATVNDSDSVMVEPGAKATFVATANEGALFTGWKSSAQDEGYVSQAASYDVTVYDEPVSLVAVFETPFTGAGTSDEPFIISSQADLEKLSSLLASTNFADQYFEMQDDIEVSDFAAIGGTNKFAGTFNGHGYTLSGLITPLFKEIAVAGKLANLNVSGNVTASEMYSGLAVGRCDGVLENIHASGTIVSSAQYVGGLAGAAGNDIIECSSSVEVTCTYDSTTTLGHVGGLVGQYGTYNNNTMTNCFATGSVEGPGLVGGLVGDLYSTNSLKDCYATGNVTAKGYSAGGLVGKFESQGSIKNCYATGAVSGTKYAGGLVGSCEVNKETALIDSCYATGAVTASTDYAGGIIGYTTKAATLSNCEARNVTVTSAGSNVGRVAGANVVASWGGGTTLTNNVANGRMKLQASGATKTLTDADKGAATINGADVTPAPDMTALDAAVAAAQALDTSKYTATSCEALKAALTAAAAITDFSTQAEVDAAAKAVNDAAAALVTKGDVNNNGSMNIVDAQIAYDLAANKFSEATLASLIAQFGESATIDTVKDAADMNDDDDVDATDALAIQHAIHYAQ